MGGTYSYATSQTAVKWQGAWDAARLYNPGHAVTYAGKLYFALVTSTGVTPTAGATWDEALAALQGGEWTYIVIGSGGVKADHVTVGFAGTDAADINIVADNKAYLTGYLAVNINAQAGDVLVAGPGTVHINGTGAGGPGTGDVLVDARNDVTVNAVTGDLLAAGGGTGTFVGYTSAELHGTAGNVLLKAVQGVALGSNGGKGCNLILDGASTGKPIFQLGQQFTTPAGTDSEKITAIIAILNTLGLFAAP